MLKDFFRQFNSKPLNYKWYKKIGGQVYCFNGGDTKEIRRCLDEHESESRTQWEINEVSDEELSHLIAEIESARRTLKHSYVMIKSTSKTGLQTI